MGETISQAETELQTPPAAAPQQTVVVERTLVTPSRVIPSGSEPGVAPQSVSRHETVVRNEGPRVHIGVVEVVVAAPAEKRAPAAAPAPSSNLASRRYLRSL